MFVTTKLARAVGLSAAAGLLAATPPLRAQFGGSSLPSIPRAKAPASSDGCPKGKSKSAGSSILGSIAGQVTGRVANQARMGSFVPIPAVAQQLTNAIACRLDSQEQQQAADATLAATRGDARAPEPMVGASAEWTSQTRPDVRGKSTVVARTNEPGGAMKCITVTDVIIVNGEETTANKRMCRSPGAARYSLMA